MRQLLLAVILFIGAGSLFFFPFGSPEHPFFVQEGVSRQEQRKGISVETYNSRKEKIRMEFDAAPERVIVVEYNNLETMLALGLGDRVVGARVVANAPSFQRLESKYPGELSKIVHTFPDGIAKETAISLQPDFILGWRSTFSDKYLGGTEWWNGRGVKTYIVATSNRTVPYGTIEDEIQYLRDMGRIFRREEQANLYIEQIRQYLEDMQRKTANKPSPRVMIIEGMGNRIANYAEGWLVGDMVRKLGGTMIAAENMIGIEDLIEYDPEVIFVVHYGAETKRMVETVLTNPRYNSLQAVQARRVYGIPLYCMYSTGVATIEGLDILARGMYPEPAEGDKTTE